jgi:subtilisin family serine protease
MSVMSAKHDSQNLAGIAPGSELWAYNVYDSGTQLYDAIEGAKADRGSNQRLVFQGGIQGDWWSNGASQAEMQAAIDETEDYGFFAMAAGNYGDKTSVAGIAQAETTNGNVASIGALKHSGAMNDVDGITNYDSHELADYSNAGANLTLVAPTDSPSINGDGDITDYGGTSCANPNVAGVAALVWSENTCLSGSDVRDLLTHSAMDLGDFGRDTTFGHGLVNAESAVRRSHALAENYELASFYTNDQFLA